jgi:hypothetical protein
MIGRGRLGALWGTHSTRLPSVCAKILSSEGSICLKNESSYTYLPSRFHDCDWLHLFHAHVSDSRILRKEESLDEGHTVVPDFEWIVFDDRGCGDLILWTNSGPKYSTCSTDLMIRNRGSRRHHTVPKLLSSQRRHISPIISWPSVHDLRRQG